MPTGLAVAHCNDILKAIYQQGTYTGPAALWAKLHVGDPGANATANAAVNTVRKECTAAFGTDPTGAHITNDALIGTWDDAPAAEKYTHVSLWDDPDAGNLVDTGTITANTVAIGDSFDIPEGDFTSAFTPAS